jgi:tRNA uridine 5-carboxymethylaminomethyl modification enzyme
LASRARTLGLHSNEALDRIETILEGQRTLLGALRERVLVPNSETQKRLSDLGTAGLLKPATAEELLRRPEVELSMLEVFGIEAGDDLAITEPVEIEVKYAGYISRQEEIIEQTKKLEEFKLPSDLSYVQVKGLSREEVEKLSSHRPMTLGQAQRISGVNPSAIQALLVHLKGRRKIREIGLEQRSERDLA